MEQITSLDKLISDKVFKKCVDNGYDKYSQISILLNTSDSFVKAVFSSHRKKLNLYHLLKLAYELNCDISDFIPTVADYKTLNKNIETEKDGFYIALEEKK